MAGGLSLRYAAETAKRESCECEGGNCFQPPRLSRNPPGAASNFLPRNYNVSRGPNAARVAAYAFA
jgi:hypothetical protein